MDDFRATVKYFGAVPNRSLTSADMKLLISGAWRNVGELWHRQMRPKHFRMAAYQEYDYAPRKPGYVKRKRLTKHHNLPLVWSGGADSLRELSRARRIETKTFRARSGMRVIMPGARKANWRHPASQVNMRQELTRISGQEVPVMVEEHNRTMAEKLRLFGGSTSKNM